MLRRTVHLVLTLSLVSTTHLQRHDGSIDRGTCALAGRCLILTLALYLQICRGLRLLCLRLLVYLLLSFGRGLTNILIEHFEVAALQADVLGADLRSHPHRPLDVQLHALEILLEGVAQLAEVVPGRGEGEQEERLWRREGLVSRSQVFLVGVRVVGRGLQRRKGRSLNGLHLLLGDGEDEVCKDLPQLEAAPFLADLDAVPCCAPPE